MERRVKSVVPKRDKGIRVSLAEEMPDSDAVLVKGSILRFSDSFAKALRLSEKDSVQTFVLDDGEWGIAVLPETTDNRSGYTPHLSNSGWQITCAHQRKRGLEEGIYLVGSPFMHRHKGDELDVYPLEWVKKVR